MCDPLLEMKDKMNSTLAEAVADWNLDSLVTSFLGRKEKTEEIKAALSKALMDTTNHEMALSTRDRVTRFIRSTNKSNLIAHNERIKYTLDRTLQCKQNTKY